MANPVIQQSPAPQGELVDELPSVSHYSQLRRDQNVPKYTYTIPNKARTREKDPKKVTLIELSANEQMLARRQGGEDGRGAPEELVKMALFEVDGRRVVQANADQDTLWGRFGPKVRHLLMLAYAEIHQANKEDEDGFFASRVIEVGSA